MQFSREVVKALISHGQTNEARDAGRFCDAAVRRTGK